MSCLAVLDTNPRFLATAMADIHLNNTTILCAQILSDSVRRLSKPMRCVNARGVRQDAIIIDDGNPLVLLRQSSDPQYVPWVDWAVEDVSHMWWLTQLAFFCDRERIHRFYLDEEHGPIYEKVDRWVKNRIASLFPKNDDKTKGHNFPIVLPKGSVIVSGDAVEAYRHYYSVTKKDGYERMKWTNRAEPSWLGATLPETTLKACKECGQSDPDARICDFFGCPNKKAYNL